jgi:CheY-like chemotaxis protein
MPMSPQHPELLPLRILIADPCPQSVASLATWLEYWGHEAKAVADGGTALDALQLFCPEVLLLELDSPRIDATALVMAVRADRVRRTLLIVAYSRDAYAPARLRVTLAGADHVLGKPTDPDDLFDILIERQSLLINGLRPNAGRKPCRGTGVLTLR